MKPGDLEYQALVQKIMEENRAASFSEARRMVSQAGDKMHKYTQLTESECKSEVAEILGGAVSTLESEVEDRTVNEVQPIPPKRKRGRPVGSRNKVKPPKGS